MPTYTVQSPSGQTLEIEGDSPPTEKELDEIFASVAPADVKVPVDSPSAIPESKKSISRNPRTGLPDLRDLTRFESAVKSVEQAGIRGAPPAIGQAVGAATGPFAAGAVPILGLIGGLVGEYLGNLREKRNGTAGSYVRAGISGAIPGGSLARATGREVLKEGAKYAAGEVAGVAAEAAIDENKDFSPQEALASIAGGYAGAGAGKAFSKIASPNEVEELFLKRNENFRALRKSGANVAVSPAEMGRAETATAFAGPVALEKKMAQKNAVEFQKLIRSDIGLAENGKYRKAIDFEGELLPAREKSYEPYRKIEKIHDESVESLSAINRAYSSPQELAAALDTPEAKKLVIGAAADVNLLKETRVKANQAYDLLKTGKNPEAYDTWRSLSEQAEVIEDAIEEAGKIAGDEKLLAEIRSARRDIAKTYAVENAMNKDTGLVDAIELAAMKEDGVALDGGLQKIAAFANSFHKESVDSVRMRNRGDGKMTALLSMNQASRGDLPGFVGAIASKTSGPALRPILASDWFQNYMFKTPQESQNFSAAMARYLAEIEAGRLAEEEESQAPVYP